MTTSLGTIPEDFPINGVYEAPVLATLPALLYGMRPIFRELIWDADGGFAEDWRDRSAVTGNHTDGYVFLLGRRAFSAGSLAIFASDAASGGGGGGGTDATSIQGVPVSPVGPNVGQVLTYTVDGDAEWVNLPSSGSGDVVGPASATADSLAVFNGTSGKLLKDGGQTVAQVVASAAAASRWKSVLDVNLVTDAAFSFANGAQTWQGLTARGQNLTGGNTAAVVAGTGLVITNVTNGFFFPSSADGAPKLNFLLNEIYPNFVLGVDKLRIRTDIIRPTVSANYQGWTLGRYPFVVNQAQHFTSFQSNTASGATAKVWRDASQYNTSLVSDSITSLYFETMNRGRLTHQPAVAGVVASDPNSMAFSPKADILFAEVIFDTSAGGGIVNAGYVGASSDIAFSLFASGSGEVMTVKRIRIEVLPG